MSIRQWNNIHPNARISPKVKIGKFNYIEEYVFIGKGTKIKHYVYICNGVLIEENVFIGSGTKFINDKFIGRYEEPTKRFICYIGRGVKIGANCSILPVAIEKGAIIGAGSVVTKNVPAFEVWAGNPAKKINSVKTLKLTPKGAD